MTSRVNQHGLAVAKQICSDDLSLLLAWYQNHNQSRVVVKPIDSAGSEDVFICDNQDSLANAIKKIIGKSNLIGGLNSKVLLQEYLSGTEYVINTVAYQGKQWFTDVWKVTKHLNAAGRNLYDYDELCNPEDPAVLACIDYVEHCLNALELTFGPGHTEVILTEKGPHLLETAARISGAANPKLIGDATGTDQVRLSAISCIAPEKLKNYPTHYERRMYARSVHLQVRNPHVFSHDKVRRFLNTLPSFSNVIFRAQDNSEVDITCDVSTCPAAFFLGHQDETQIEQDYQDFRAWEFKNL
jgi:biotin carboxylase